MKSASAPLWSFQHNAFLTLRVGMITKEYCCCTVRVEKTGLQRAATVKAAKLLWLNCSGWNCEVVEGHGEGIKNKTEPSVRACNQKVWNGENHILIP